MISPEQGVGIEFENNGKKCITLPRTSVYDFGVTVNVYTYADNLIFAKHFYASLHISDVKCKIIDDKSDMTFTSNTQPKESLFERIDVKYKSPVDVYSEDVYGETFGAKTIEVRKGCPTSRFDTIEDCVEAIESTFIKECGGEPWILVDDNYDSWEEAKERLIKLYSEGD